MHFIFTHSVEQNIIVLKFFFALSKPLLVSYGAVIGLQADTHLHGSEYSLLTTMFYLGKSSINIYMCVRVNTIPF